MTYESEMKVWENDFGYDIPFTCFQSDGSTPYDLTDFTGLEVRITDASFGKLQVKASATVVSAVDGTCKYTVQDGDFPQAGKKYYAAIVATKTGAEITFGDLIIRVEKKPPKQ